MKRALYTLLLACLTVTLAWSQKAVLVPAVDHPVYFDVSPALRDMVRIEIPQYDGSWKDGVVNNQIDRQEGRDIYGNRDGMRDPSLQDHFGLLPADTTLQNFDGMGNGGGYVPPDTHGDVGPNHFFQVVNCSYAIFNKTGYRIFGPFPNSSVFSGMPHNSNDGDAIVLYDEQANRWLFSQFSLPNGSSTAPFYQMIAVSQTPDPTGSWYRWVYEFSAMPDYPKFGVWTDAYYMSTNNFGTGGQGWVGNGAYSYDRAAMLAGNPDAVRISFNVPPGNEGFITLLPADCDGVQPPAGTPNYFAYIRTGGTQRLGIYEFHSDFSTPANSTFGNITYLPVTPFGTLGWGNGIPQLGSPQVLETLGDRLMYRLQYRLFNGYSSMVLNHSVNTGAGKAGIRWYELRNTGTAWSIYQQSTFAPDEHSRWMGSIAQDTAGTIAMGYSVSSSSLYPGIRYTGRLKNDPLNQMTIAEKVIVNGGGSQTGSWSGRSRWGDYSAICIDPVNPTTFWFTTEYYASTSASSWKTRIASFTYDNVFSSAVSASPGIICEENSDSCHLQAFAYGGSGNYTFSWTSIPPGFTSNLQNPVVRPAQTTRYICATSDGTTVRHDTTEFRIAGAATAYAGNDTIVCWYVSPIPIHATATNYSRFIWGSTGDGTFSDPNALITSYLPGIKDKTKGSVDLKLIAWPIAPCLDKATDMIHITLDPCTGFSQPAGTELTLEISPNPARDQTTITMTGLTGEAVYSLIGLDGKAVLSGPLEPGKEGFARTTVDLAGFAKGIYLVRLDCKAKTLTAKLVVN